MLYSKNESVRPLLESTCGIHLSVYIANSGDPDQLKNKLRNALDEACEYLVFAMSFRDIEHFFKPIELLINDSKKLSNFKGNLGIFRTKNSFRVLSLPIEVQTTCIVADTFHVKPLLKWMQTDREFIFLGIESNTATLYQGNLHIFKEIDTIVFPNLILNFTKKNALEDCHSKMVRQENLREAMEWINGWVMNLTNEVRPRLFVAGKRELTSVLLGMMQYENMVSLPICASFSSSRATRICAEIRSVLKNEIRKDFEKTILEFYYAIDLGLARGSIYTIAKAAVEGKIRKLLISEQNKIFGKMNRKNGEISIHGADTDHEDDDILDDLAQTVLANGGEVIMAPIGIIPQGRPILAIIYDTPNSEIAKRAVIAREVEHYQERSPI